MTGYPRFKLSKVISFENVLLPLQQKCTVAHVADHDDDEEALDLETYTESDLEDDDPVRRYICV